MSDLSITVTLDGKKRTFTEKELLGSGIAGHVFSVDGKAALKIYHEPNPPLLPQHLYDFRIKKLNALLKRNLNYPKGIYGPMPVEVMRNGQLAGYMMPMRDPNENDLLEITTRSARKDKPRSAVDIVKIFMSIMKNAEWIWANFDAWGDINEWGIGVLGSIMDMDSPPHSGFPCSEQTINFIDPLLYPFIEQQHVPPYTRNTDSSSLLTLFFKALFLIHPYGGTHPKYDNIQQRAKDGIWVLNPEVAIGGKIDWTPLKPKFKEICANWFEKQQRFPLTMDFFTNYLADLQGTVANNTPIIPDASIHAALVQKWGYVVYEVNYGEITYLVTQDKSHYFYHSIYNGNLTKTWHIDLPTHLLMPKFAIWSGNLVVSPNPAMPDLYILHRENGKTLANTVTDSYNNKERVFIGTNNALYRVVNGVIMRCEWFNNKPESGQLIDRMIKQSTPNQTKLYGNYARDMVFGYLRAFDSVSRRYNIYNHWLISNRGSLNMGVPSLLPDEELISAIIPNWDTDAAVFIRHTRNNGKESVRVDEFEYRTGKLLRSVTTGNVARYQNLF